jgi:hypothetical protein
MGNIKSCLHREDRSPRKQSFQDKDKDKLNSGRYSNSKEARKLKRP